MNQVHGYLRIRCVTGFALLAACIVLRAAEPTDKGAVDLQVISGEETGLTKIMENWAADELQRQGGKYGDHGWWLWGLTAVDFDNDGDADLVPTHHGSSGGLLIRNLLKETGKLTFTNATAAMGVASRDLPQGMGLRTFAMDLNGDGWLDLVGVRSAHFINEKGMRFVPAGKQRFDTIYPLSTDDFNGDGHPDFEDGVNAMIWNPAASEFKAQALSLPFTSNIPPVVMEQVAEKLKKVRFWRYHYITDCDLDGDGINDVVVTGFAGYSGNGQTRFLAADKDGRLADRTDASGLPGDAAIILLFDFNGDGAVDVLNAQTPQSGLYLNDGHGKFTLTPGPVTAFLKQTGPYLHRAWAVDFNCDGKPDLVLSNPRFGRAEIYENLGGGNFKVLHKATGWDSDPVAVCDVDGDGLPDVVIGGPANSITIYLNRTPAPGRYCNIYPRMNAPNLFAVGSVVEVYRAGELGKSGSRPILRSKAPADGTPVHIGLGEAKQFDLRVRFPAPDRKLVELTAVETKKVTVTPDGKIGELP